MQGRESCFQTTICKDARRGSRKKEGEREEKILEGYVVFCSDLFVDGVAPKSDLKGPREGKIGREIAGTHWKMAIIVFCFG